MPQLIFENRVQLFTQEEKRYRQKSRALGWLRLGIFLSGAAACGYLFYHNNTAIGFLVLVVFYALFLVVLKKHTHLQYTQKHFGFLKKINQEEQERLKGNLPLFETGDGFKNSQHLYTSDLDIFGNYSLYQLLNRAVSIVGKNKLASWLQSAAPAPEIESRQQAIAELAPDIDWRQHLQAKALHYKQVVAEPFAFFDWLQAPDFYRNKKWLKIGVFVLPVFTLAALVFWFMGYSGYPAAGLVLLQYLLCYKYNQARDEYYEKSSDMYDVLRCYRDLLAHLETRPSHAPKLSELIQSLQVGGKPASAQIHALATIVEYLSARMNVYVSLVLNAVLMWDFYWMFRLERWKKNVAQNLEHVLDVVAETETLASLAAYQYANPAYAVPQVSSELFKLETEGLGHPLIFSSNRITNNFKTTGAGKTCIITGSNMSGKSTFLRTVGINLVLAQAGAAVNASKMIFNPVQVYTAMRTEDNLAESTSSFYAELKRLRMLLDISATGQPVFYLLDEILKGTNSGDRHAGAKALIRQLHRRTASGLVSTHDLELGALQQEHPEYITNYSFNSTIEGDKISFDYKLHDGLCKSFNASKLMQLMGIDMELSDENTRRTPSAH